MTTSPTICPMICVESVSDTSELLCKLFGWRATHGGDQFDELVDANNHRVLWLHSLRAPEHPRFDANHLGDLGRGLAIYVFVADIDAVYQKARNKQLTVVEDLALNPSAGFREFTFRGPSGYHFSVAERPT